MLDISSQSHRPTQPRVDRLAQLSNLLSPSGYTDFCVLQEQVCAIKQFNYTTAVVVGLDESGYPLFRRVSLDSTPSTTTKPG